MKNQIFSGYKLLFENHGREFSYDRFFFNTEDFLGFRQTEFKSFFWFNSLENCIDGEIHFSLQGGKAISLSYATFGSVQFSNYLTEKSLYDFLSNVEENLRENNITNVLIKHYPFVYARQESLKLIAVLKMLKYSNPYTDQSFHIQVSEPFESGLLQSEKERLRKAAKNGVLASEWSNPDLIEVHHILSVCRETKGYPMSLGIADFINMFDNFPHIYKVFKAEAEKKVIAVGVTVHINKFILYNFYIGDLPDFRSFSPVVPLVAEMISYAKSKNYKIFDLGISTNSGIVNPGLTQFKKNLGGKISDKPVFEKIIL